MALTVINTKLLTENIKLIYNILNHHLSYLLTHFRLQLVVIPLLQNSVGDYYVNRPTP